jgi:hypothetical protein
MDDLILTTGVGIAVRRELGKITHGMPTEGDAVLGEEQGRRVSSLAGVDAPDGSGGGDGWFHGVIECESYIRSMNDRS